AVDGEIVCGGKEASVSGDAIHAIRSRIVHFTAQPQFAFRSGIHAAVAEIAHLTATPLGGRDPRFQCWTRPKAGIAHAQWSKNVLLRELIERHPTDARDDFTERDESDVAVGEASSGRIAKWFLDQTLNCFVVAGPTLAQIEVRGVTGD